MAFNCFSAKLLVLEMYKTVIAGFLVISHATSYASNIDF